MTKRKMKYLVSIFFLVTSVLTARVYDPSVANEVVFQTNFDTPAERQAWPQADFANWEITFEGTTSLCITVPSDQGAGVHMIRPSQETTDRMKPLLECFHKNLKPDMSVPREQL